MNITKQFLLKEYIRKRKTIKQIAKEYNKAYGTIRYWLIKYQISIRTKSEALKGRKRPDLTLYNQTRNNKGKNNGNYKRGKCLIKHYCKTCCKEICMITGIYGQGRCAICAKKGLRNPFFGKTHTQKQRAKILKSISEYYKHHKSGNYIDGRTPLTILIRNLLEYKNWRTEVFKKDNFTCQECGKTKCYIEAHHKKEFHIILAEFLKQYDQFSPIEDKETLGRLAMKYKPFWDIENGQTLCKDCHKLTRGVKNASV